MDSTSFGQLIKLLRERKKMTQENLANMLNVSTSTVCKWEKGNNLPDVNMFKKISEVLEISLDALHNPQEALSQIENPVPHIDKENAFCKKKYFMIVFSILLFFIIIGGFLSFYNSKSKDLNITQVAFRTTVDEVCGTVYEVACVYTGNIDEITTSSPYVLLLSSDWENNTFVDSSITIMKISFFTTEKNARQWQSPQKSIYITR